MSYCVNCGVELDSSLSACPLCQTPVINPNSLKPQTSSPYPEKNGVVEPANRKDFTILLSITMLTVAVACSLLNIQLFSSVLWSIPVVGLCLFVWICFLPVTLLPKLPRPLIIPIDGVALSMYLYMISYLTPSKMWYFKVALPLTAIITILLLSLVLLTRFFHFNILSSLLYIIISTAIICVAIESLVDYMLRGHISLTWSALVLTVCIIIAITLITILSIRRIRQTVQRRLHF